MSTWRLLGRVWHHHTAVLAATTLGWTLFFGLEIGIALVLQAFFDDLSGHARASLGPWTLIALLVAAELSRSGLWYGFTAGTVTYAHLTGALLRNNLLRRILERPGAVAVVVAPGEALNRLNGDTSMGNINFALYNLVSLCLFSAGALWVMMRVSVPITLAVFLPFAMVTVVARQASARVEAYHQASRQAADRVSSLIGEMFAGVQAIKVADAEERVADRFRRLNGARRRAALRERLLDQILNSLVGNIGDIGTGLILLLIGGAIRAGSFTVGDFALFVFFLGRIAQCTSFVGIFWTHYKQFGVSLQRLGELVPEMPPEEIVVPAPVYLRGPLPAQKFVEKDPADALIALEAVGLTYRHPTTGRGVVGVSLRVERGTLTVITGRVSAGKTTLLRALLGQLPREAGEVYWNGAPVADLRADLAPPRCAYAPQVPHLFSETLRDNILLGLPAERAGLAAATYLAVLDEDIATLDDGLGTVVGPRGIRLSGGQIQRTAAARMLARWPELLVVDDLSSALDVETEARLWARLRARQPAVTCLAVAHRPAALRAADRIIVLAHGTIEAQGTLEELLQTSVEMQRLWTGDVGELLP